MAEGKKSFIIYTDSRGIVNKLSNERAGILFKTLFSYCDDENPICDDEVVDMAFEHFKNILKRDLRKYKNIVERNRENGKTGGRPKNPVGFLETQQNPTKPKKADNDNDTDNDNVTVKKKVCKEPGGSTHTPDQIELFNQFSDWLSKHFPRVTKMKKPISIDEYLKLKETLTRETLTKLLTAMENRADLHKKYVSAYLTIINWSKNEFNQPEQRPEQGSVLTALKNFKAKEDAA